MVQKAKKKRSKKAGKNRRKPDNNGDRLPSHNDEPENASGNRSESDELETDTDEEQEDVSDYCKGGYHVVKIGDLFHGRYHTIRKLGWGHFSTVWLAWDLTEKRFVALKIVKSAWHYTETAMDEIKLLRAVHTSDTSDEGYPHLVQLLDDFKITGIHGSHICMVFEVLGHNLLKYIIKSSYRGISIPMVKSIIRQTLMGLNYIHTKCKIIHTDIKPENILICINEEEIQKLALDATVASQKGKITKSLAATAPRQLVQKQTETAGKMSKNKKKKLKRKIKKQLEKHSEDINEKYHNGAAGGGGSGTPGAASQQSGGEEANAEGDDENADNAESNNNTDQSNAATVTAAGTTIKTIPGVTQNEMMATCSGDNAREQPVALAPAETNSDSNGNDHDGADATDDATMLQRPQSDVRMSSAERGVDCNGEKVGREASGAEASGAVSDEKPQDDVEMMDRDIQAINGMSEKLAERLKISHEEEEMDEKPPSESGDSIDLPESQARSFLDNPDINVKLADLGNACWVHHHYTEEIQTRQYRSLEVLLGAGYGPPADIWSTACMAFELATGDFLFEPHSGEDYSRDEDHIALVIELLGRIPRHIALAGKYSKEFFSRKGDLRHIKKLKPWNLYDVLTEKYEWSHKDARDFQEFLEPMLDYVPDKRATAAQCLQHPWLQAEPNGRRSASSSRSKERSSSAAGNHQPSSDQEPRVNSEIGQALCEDDRADDISPPRCDDDDDDDQQLPDPILMDTRPADLDKISAAAT